ncbi:hypothetical protein K438DRAFT_66859 [Mycena galopus ATCC 62051]|nr:hypothetical protein K438DRAFT_66859 [Mycena galopus ATCC 62051]
MSSLYVLCPECKKQIPAALRCRGTREPAHDGLYFQRCEDCNYYKWVPPPTSSAYNINPGELNNDPFPRNEALRSPTPLPQVIDPALTLSLPTPTAPGSGPSASGKKKCKHVGCTRQAGSKDCTHGMCKTCCQMKGAGCKYVPHRNSTPVVATDGNPSTLARPPPIIPPSTPENPSDLPPKMYKKPMDEAWAKQYTQAVQKRERIQSEADQKRVEAQRAQHQIRICYFYKDGEEPEDYRIQGITTFPHVNLAHFPKILAKMKLEPDEDAYFYDFAAGVWGRDEVNTTFTVVSNETLIVRRTDVSSKTAGIEDMIRLHAPERKSGKATTAKRKPDHERESSNRIIQAPRTAVADARPCRRSSSPILVVSSPSSPAPPSPSRSSSPFPLTLLPRSRSSSIIDLTGSESRPHSPDVLVKSEPIDIANSVANADQLWESGRVYVPQGCGSWPGGIYTRDMAFAFKKNLLKQG